MENMMTYLPEVYKKLKKLFVYYIVSGIIFTLVISCAIMIKKYTISLYETYDSLLEFNIRYLKIKGATKDVDESIKTIKMLLPANLDAHSPEEFILITLDDLKSRMDKKAYVTVTNIEDKGNEIQLPVNIKGPLRDYTTMVNQVGYLQSLKFPFFAINGIKISKSDVQAKSLTTFEIVGVLKFPKTGSQTTETMGQRARGKL
jgi:hypothetical protein